MVPVFPESCFAFIGALSAAAGAKGFPAAQGGIIMAGLLCAGLGVGSLGGIPLRLGHLSLNVFALFVVTVVGVIMNLIIPERKTNA